MEDMRVRPFKSRFRVFCNLMATLIGLALVSGQILAVQSPPVLFEEPLSPRIANYEIWVDYDPGKRMINGREVLTWYNKSESPVSELQFHLYLNAFRNNQSTFARESKSRKKDGWGFIEVKRIEVAANPGHFLSKYGSEWSPEFPLNIDPGNTRRIEGMAEFIHPDDENSDDRTVLRLPLPGDLLPGQGIQLEIDFVAVMPTPPSTRTGVKEEFIFAGQWFPKVGVWQSGVWNCHQFHAYSEFFADYGIYDVHIEVPFDYVIGATGQEYFSENGSEGKTIHHYHAEDVHDFAWTGSPEYLVFTGKAQNVEIRALVQPDHEAQGMRHIRAAELSVDWFHKTYGPYPYPNLTVVDPRRGAQGVGGMEYPTLITAGTVYGLPEGVRALELVIMHEFGHNYWYHLVANNEFEESWMDEGINTYSEIQFMEEVLGLAIDLPGLKISDETFHRVRFISLPDADPIIRNSWQYYSGESYGVNSYSRPGLVLQTLHNYLGAEKMNQAMRLYFERFSFQHPTSRDFMDTVSEIHGESLDWFFDQAFYSNAVLDYSISYLESREIEKRGIDVDLDPEVVISEGEGLEDSPERTENDEDSVEYETEVRVRRLGQFQFPVTIEVKFEDGSSIREQWDGKELWKKMTYRGFSKVASASVDPEYQIPIDVSYINNSRVIDPGYEGLKTMSVRSVLVWQILLDLMSWF